MALLWQATVEGTLKKILQIIACKRNNNQVICGIFGPCLIEYFIFYSHTRVKFRMIIFKPFLGEILVGRIKECTQDYIRGKSMMI
jgi:hypothetical protein